MKLILGNVTLYFGVSIAKREKSYRVQPSATYFSRSCGRVLNISEMETTHIKNALLKSMALSELKTHESETVVEELSGIKYWESEPLGLYLELKSRVNAQVV
jgi:hypothetical protein